MLPRNVQRLQVLDGCSGVLLPGRLTLLLGPPASGKTSLLKALAGKLDSCNLEVRLAHGVYTPAEFAASVRACQNRHRPTG